jgi:hypothetical protein
LDISNGRGSERKLGFGIKNMLKEMKLLRKLGSTHSFPKIPAPENALSDLQGTFRN